MPVSEQAPRPRGQRRNELAAHRGRNPETRVVTRNVRPVPPMCIQKLEAINATINKFKIAPMPEVMSCLSQLKQLSAEFLAEQIYFHTRHHAEDPTSIDLAPFMVIATARINDNYRAFETHAEDPTFHAAIRGFAINDLMELKSNVIFVTKVKSLAVRNRGEVQISELLGEAFPGQLQIVPSQ